MLESVLSTLRLSQLDLVVTAGSAVVVMLLVVVAYAAGFRAVARLSEPELARLAAAEGATVEAAVIEPNGRAALARLTGGKLLLARVMGDNIGARVAPRSAATVRLKKNRVSAGFGDTGFPRISWRLQGDAPGWLRELARE
jgi:hypothetical protein